MSKSQNDKRVVAHYTSTYLPITQNWIYRTIINQQRFSPIFLSRKKQNLSQFPISSHYSLDDLGRSRQVAEIFLFRILGYFPFFKSTCRYHNAQILHAHFGYHGVKSVGLKRKLGIPMVCSFYGDDAFSRPHVGQTKKQYRYLFRQADRILVLGPYMRSHLIGLGCNTEKISILHLGIDVDKIRFERRSLLPGAKVRFLVVSSFVEKKGIDIAIKALAKLKNEANFSLDIIGDGQLKSKILTLVEQSGLQERITFHGYKPYSYFIELAYRCDVFIQASRTGSGNSKEGTPMAIVDAMATGMPVVSTRHSDIPEIVRENETGYLAEENSIDSLVECLRMVFSNPEKMEKFSLNGRSWIEKEFNARIQTQKLEECYEQLL
jgi:colanic acid/amylovoran biosynthesis glycosyltransferase